MRKWLFLTFTIVLISMASAVSASVDIDIQVDDFTVGELVRFDFTITPDRDVDITYVPRIRCADGFETFLENRRVSLRMGVPLTGTYEGFVVTSEMTSKSCMAVIKIIDPFIRVKEEEFGIGALSQFNFDTVICRDSACTEESKMFLRHQQVYLDYLSDLDRPTVTAMLVKPDKTEQQISLPTSFNADQTGTYELMVTVAKAGYKTITSSEQFGVIDKQAAIPLYIFCNGNGVCSNLENYQNCPQDCPSGSSDGFCDEVVDEICDPDCLYGDDPDCQIPLAVIFIIVALVVVVIAFLFTYKRHSKPVDKEWERIKKKYSK